MIVSFNFYYARPGVADAVLAQRLRASEVRARIGLSYGLVMNRTAGSGELPEVVWEQDFADVAGHHADMAARAASPEFEAIRSGMRPLLRRFERPLFEVCGAASTAVTTARRGVVALDWIFCAPEKAAMVLAVLEKRAGAGAERSRLLRLITPGPDLPDLIWQHDYRDVGGCERAQALPEYSAWRLAVNAHVKDVQPSAWRILDRAAG